MYSVHLYSVMRVV